MLFVLLLTLPLVLHVQCTILSKFVYSPNCDDALKPYRLTCGLKANGLEYCAARIHRSNFACEPLTVDWCESRTKLPEYYYMEKRTVKIIKTNPTGANHLSYPIPVWIEPGAEISVAITPVSTFKVQIAMFSADGTDSNMYLGCWCSQVNGTISYDAWMEHHVYNNDPSLTCSPKMLVITMRFTAIGFKAIVDGKLRHEFTFFRSRPPGKDLRNVAVNILDGTSRYHFIRYTSAHHDL